MTYSTPRFWAQPLHYLRWSARERPAYFWSIVIGTLGPIQIFTIPPIRRYFGDLDAPNVPVTYPGTLVSQRA